MKIIIVGVITALAIGIFAFYSQDFQFESKSNVNSFSWEGFSNDAKHSWNGQDFLIKKYSPYKHLPLMYTDVYKESNDLITYEMLDAAIGMYMITGEQHYLDKALSIASEIEEILVDDKFVLLQVPSDNMLPVTTNRVALNYVSHLAMIDESKTELVKKLADATLDYSINDNTHLFYEYVYYNGLPGEPSMYFPYGGDVNLESLLRSYEVTKDEKYLNQVKNTILSYWDLRDKTTNLLPSKVNSDNNETVTAFMQQYGSGLFLKILLHYYYLTDDPEILHIIDTYTNSLLKYAWNGNTWNYRTYYNGTVLTPHIEANFPTLDDVFFLIYYLDKTKYQKLYDVAKQDYDNSFQNDLILTNNGLVAHSVKSDGSKDSPHSRLSYAFTSIQNPAYILFKHTQDRSYLDKVENFYNSATKYHKQEYGFINGIDAYTLENEETHVLMPSAIANKLLLTILPSPEVDVTWTVIGNHKLPVPFFSTFYSTGYFNSVHFDLKNKEITLDIVEGKGTITFESEIENVLLDGKNYENFENNVLRTVAGEHSYQIRLK